MGDVKKKADPVQRRLDRIERMLRPVRNPHLKISDIANRLKVSESKARSLLSEKGAPKPLVLVTNSSGAMLQPRFNPERIAKWIDNIETTRLVNAGQSVHPSHVYLLIHSEESSFKIGKANNVAKRILELEMKNKVLDRSLIIGCESDSDAFRVEKSLHFALSKYRHHRDVEGVSGGTEWFYLDGWDDAVLLVNTICNISDLDCINFKQLIDGEFKHCNTERIAI